MRSALAAAFLLLAAPASAQSRPQPSFDCGEASAADERTICGDPRLSELDQAVSIAFGQVPASERRYAQQDAREALANRRACDRGSLCILDQQVKALGLFDGYGPQIPVPPWVGAYRLSLFERRGEPAVAGLPTRVA